MSRESGKNETVSLRLDGRYAFEKRGLVPIKGKGKMVTYLLQGPA